MFCEAISAPIGEYREQRERLLRRTECLAPANDLLLAKTAEVLPQQTNDRYTCLVILPEDNEGQIGAWVALHDYLHCV